MRAPKALVLGATGMLGSAVREQLELSDIVTVCASRSRGIQFDAETGRCEYALEMASLQPNDFVVNCVGLTKKHIYEGDATTVERAVRLNVLFPVDLAKTAENLGVRVIQVATDCVFSGNEGRYSEMSGHDALDTYGKTKSLGEVVSNSVMHLRCSLIGPESNERNTLFFEWVRRSPKNSILKGYVNHRWNGLTSHAFGKIVAGIIKHQEFSAGVQHLVPRDSVTKHELAKIQLGLLHRKDVTLEEVEAEVAIDRTLSTSRPEINRRLFELGGYPKVPTIREMMEGLPWEQLRLR